LRQRIIELGVSKYNLGGEELRLPARGGRRVILVPGQVEDDASVARGSSSLRDNAALLGAVREENPGAYILYRTHPDVASGNRRGQLPPAALGLCDERVDHASIAACLEAADEVHTLTSLVGFEGLLRERRVVTYGRPFYSGWGLTLDRDPNPRRTRRLTLDELVAGVLLRYPRYFSFKANAFVSAEATLEELAAARGSGEGRLSLHLPHPWRQLQKLAVLLKEIARVA
jgi:capsular polysaccharide export protein